MAIKSRQMVCLKREIDDSYPINFGGNLFPELANSLSADRRYAIITDSNVKKLYGEKLEQMLAERGLDCQGISFPAGEQSKTWEMAGRIHGALADAKLDRDSLLIALGGGVVGDMAGFIAGTFLRGVDYWQLPSTLLACVDSSIGGKTGVDLPQGKNLAGAFKHPKAVWADIGLLQTLPIEEIRNGADEVVKYGIIRDAGLFRRLEENVDELLGKDPEFLSYVIETCCGIKRDVVQQDPEEKNIRSILNGGHTAGHGIEKLSGYRLAHGSCVSIGLMIMGRIAIALGTGFTNEDLGRVEALLKKIGSPTTIPSYISNQDIIEATTNDKKAKLNPATGFKEARYALPKTIGEMCDYGGKWKTYVDTRIVNIALDETR